MLRRSSRRALFYWAFAILPLFVCLIGLKLHKSWHVSPGLPWFERWGLLHQDQLFLLVYSLVFLVCADRIKGWLGKSFVVIFYGLTTLLCLVCLLEHAYFLRTGRLPGWSLLQYSLARIDSVMPLIRSQLTLTTWLIACSVLAYNVLPLLLSRRRGIRRWLRRGKVPDTTQLAVAEVVIVCGLAALLLFPSKQVSKEEVRVLQRNGFWRVLQEARQERQERVKLATTSLGGKRIFDASRLRLEPTKSHKKWNVVLLILESVRARSTTMFQPTLPTTPFLKSLAPKALQVRRMYPVIPHTTKALVSILCGIPPKPTPQPFEASTFGLPVRCLPKLLGDLGYGTAFFQAATRHFERRDRLIRNMGFSSFSSFEDMPTKGFTRISRHLGYEDKIMIEPGFRWIDEMRKKGKPFFASYLTLSSHFYYHLPPSFPKRTYVKNGDRYINKYLNTLRYTDSFVEAIYKGLEKRKLLDSTIFVVVGDHGEAFMEHKLRFHSDGAYDEFLRVPAMIVHPKGKKAGQWVKGNRQQMDLIPTIADMLGAKLTGGHLPGQSLLQPVSPERTLYLSCWNVPFCLAKLKGPMKWIFNFRRREHELFNLSKDPMERKNLRRSKTKPRDWKRLRKELMGWRAQVQQLYTSATASALQAKLSPIQPKVKVPINARFGKYIRLVGYSLVSDSVKVGRRVRITLVYQVLKRLPKGWSFFYHGYSIRRVRRRQWREKFSNLRLAPLVGGISPQDWAPGMYISDEQSFQLRPGSHNIRRGMRFQLYLGIWHAKQGRLPVHNAHGRPVRNRRLFVCEIQVL